MLSRITTLCNRNEQESITECTACRTVRHTGLLQEKTMSLFTPVNQEQDSEASRGTSSHKLNIWSSGKDQAMCCASNAYFSVHRGCKEWLQDLVTVQDLLKLGRGSWNVCLCVSWQITEEISVKHLPSSEPDPHVVRVGWSLDSCSTQLGEWKTHTHTHNWETALHLPSLKSFSCRLCKWLIFSCILLGEEPFSYGYGGTGKKSSSCKFEDYGQKFGENDVVGCYIVSSAGISENTILTVPHNDCVRSYIHVLMFQDFDSSHEVEISFSKNGKWLDVAFRVRKEELSGRALFPHILVKNCAVEFNFGQKEEPFFPSPEGYEFIQTIAVEDRIRGTVGPATKADCEVGTIGNPILCQIYVCSSNLFITFFRNLHIPNGTV